MAIKPAACATALVLAVASAAWANTTMTFEGEGLNSIVQIHAPGTLADGQTVYAGQLLINVDGTRYTGYCVDLNQYSGNGDASILSAQSLNHGSQIAYLFNTYAFTVPDGVAAGALGAAIWEVLTEPQDTFDVTSGAFSISGNDAVIAQANSLLASLPSSYHPASWPMVLHSESVQDVVISAVPEPAALGLLLLGSAGLVMRHRRNEKSTRNACQ